MIEALIIVAVIGFMEYLITFSEINRNQITTEGFSSMSVKKLTIHSGVLIMAIAAVAFLWVYALKTAATRPSPISSSKVS